MKVVEKKLVFPNPPGVLTAYEYEYYARPTGVDKVRLRYLDINNDIFDNGSLHFSDDNGRTWRDGRPSMMGERTADGVLRYFDCIGWVDPGTGKLVTIYLKGLFRNDDLLEGMSGYYLNYRVSSDGGRTNEIDEQAIQAGGGYDARHPFDDVWIGKNAVYIALNPPIVRTKRGEICLVVSMSVVGPDGKLLNPGGGFTWMEELVLIGQWRADGRIDWKPVARLALPGDKSTRGLDESTLTEMPDGTLLLIMRGSNDGEGKMPGYKWRSVSRDGGHTWSPVEPWRYSDGSPFFSSASMSLIVPHSGGKRFWIGNLSEENPRANLPRDVLYIGEVDPKTYGLVRPSLFVIDRLKPGEPANGQLSNFSAHEDRETGEIVLNMPYFLPRDGSWVGDTYRYRIDVT